MATVSAMSLIPNIFMHSAKGATTGWGGVGGFGPPKFGRTTPTFLMKSVITVT